MVDRRQADADEIEITKTMLEAGVAEFPTTDDFYHTDPEAIVSWIYRAMFAARRGSGRGSASSAE